MAFWPALQFGIFMTIAAVFSVFLGLPVTWTLGLFVAGVGGFALGVVIQRRPLE